MMVFPYSESLLLAGKVHHHRQTGKRHRFGYNVLYTLLNLDEVENTFARSALWSINRFNLISLREQDFLPGRNATLKQRVIECVREKAIIPASASIEVWLLAQLRHFGKNFNPVCFYLVVLKDASGKRSLHSIVAEITNTPWDERHSYVLLVSDAQSKDPTGDHSVRFQFDKQFHVSPFLPMELAYDWRFTLKQKQLACHMTVRKDSRVQFSAWMDLNPEPLTSSRMRWLPFRYGASTVLTLVRIYWQAARLWLKKTPFFPHPQARS